MSLTQTAKTGGLPRGHGGLGNRVKKTKPSLFLGLLVLAFFQLMQFIKTFFFQKMTYLGAGGFFNKGFLKSDLEVNNKKISIEN